MCAMTPCPLDGFKTMLAVTSLFVAVSQGGDARAATGDRLDRSKLTLTFEEEFTGPLNLWDARSGGGRWKTCYWFGWQPQGLGCADKSSRTIDTDGSQYVLVDWAYNKVNPFRLSDGLLTIEAARNAHPNDPKTAGRAYTAGMITSEPSFAQRYGYFEIRTKLPAGTGLWPAFWMLPADHAVPFELDVMENHGRDPNTIYCTAHWGDGTYTLFPVKVDGVQQQRTYGVLWTSEDIVWYVDDVEVARTHNRDLNTPMYVIAGMGVGGNWGGYPDTNTKFPAEMVVDYIRTYRIER
jgi:beta-glucanase (GH16 family)